MKKFLKRNLWCIVLIFLGVLLIGLGVISAYFILFGCVMLSVVCFYYSFVLRRKYKKLLEEPEDENIFDATKLDYDEDVYYIGEKINRKKVVGKSFIGKISTNSPSIGLFLLGLGLISISVISFIKALF